MELKATCKVASWSFSLTWIRWLKSPRLTCCVASYKLATESVMVRVNLTPITRATSTMRVNRIPKATRATLTVSAQRLMATERREYRVESLVPVAISRFSAGSPVSQSVVGSWAEESNPRSQANLGGGSDPAETLLWLECP